MASNRQTTMAKLERERAVRERRARKQEKKEARRAAKAAGIEPEAQDEAPDVASDDSEVAGPVGDPSL